MRHAALNDMVRSEGRHMRHAALNDIVRSEGRHMRHTALNDIVRSEGRHMRHAALNDIVKRALSSAHIPGEVGASWSSDHEIGWQEA